MELIRNADWVLTKEKDGSLSIVSSDGQKQLKELRKRQVASLESIADFAEHMEE